MLIIALIGMPLVIGYTAFIYWRFRGKGGHARARVLTPGRSRARTDAGPGLGDGLTPVAVTGCCRAPADAGTG